MSPEECTKLNDLLMDTFFLVGKAEEAALKAAGIGDLTLSEYNLISCVAKGGEEGKTIGEIAQILDVTLPTITVIANRLVKKGYVVKCRSEEDGRVVRCRLTHEGVRINYLHRYFHRRATVNILNGFDRDELDVLMRCVGRLNEMLRDPASSAIKPERKDEEVR